MCELASLSTAELMAVATRYRLVEAVVVRDTSVVVVLPPPLNDRLTLSERQARIFLQSIIRDYLCWAGIPEDVMLRKLRDH